jgi:hypothetical protein
MRDYLSRLAGRVRHVSPALQPVLPSFFQPARVGVSPLLKVEQSEIEQSSVAEIEAVPSKANPAAGVPARDSIESDNPAEKRQFERPVRTFVRDVVQAARTQPQKVTPQASDLEETAKSSTPTNPEPSVPIVRPRPREERKSDRPATSPPGSEERVPTQPVTRTIPTTPAATSAVVPPVQSSVSPKPRDVSPEPIRPSVAPKQAESSVNAPRPVEIRSVERVTVQQAAATSVASTRPTSLGRKPPEAQTKLLSPASTMPEIHVTIGRIEVRAVSSPAQVQAPPRKPELSLDDYLRTRNQRAV